MNWRKASPSECTGKMRHKSKGAAEAALRAFERAFPAQVGKKHAYRCGTCLKWHFGRKRGA
jgi:hypothetical protein